MRSEIMHLPNTTHVVSYKALEVCDLAPFFWKELSPIFVGVNLGYHERLERINIMVSVDTSIEKIRPDKSPGGNIDSVTFGDWKGFSLIIIDLIRENINNVLMYNVLYQ